MSSELLDDPLASAMLQDALAFISDAYDTSAHALPIGPAPPSTLSFVPVKSTPPGLGSPTITEASPKPKRQRGNRKSQAQSGGSSRSHGNPKADLERLRLDVKQLETELARLKGESDPGSSPGALSSSSDDGSSANAAMWRAVAMRQYQRRSQSEQTRQQLKHVLAKQIKLAKSLEALVLRRTTQNVSASLPWADAVRGLTLLSTGPGSRLRFAGLDLASL